VRNSLSDMAIRIPRTFPRGILILSPFALRLAFPTLLAGRDSCDYYGDSVTMSLSAFRPSPVPLVRYV
jgi:hypothetical protein